MRVLDTHFDRADLWFAVYEYEDRVFARADLVQSFDGDVDRVRGALVDRSRRGGRANGQVQVGVGHVERDLPADGGRVVAGIQTAVHFRDLAGKDLVGQIIKRDLDRGADLEKLPV